MKKYRCIFLLLAFCCYFISTSLAQLRINSDKPEEEIIWLKNQLIIAKNPKKKTEVYLGLGQVYSKANQPDISFNYFEKAILCSDSSDNESHYKARFFIGKEFAKRGNFKEAYNMMFAAFELSLLNNETYTDAEKAKKLLLEYCIPAGYSSIDYNKLEKELSARLKLKKAYVNINKGLKRANSLIKSNEVDSAILIIEKSVVEADLIKLYLWQYKTRIKLSEVYILREYHSEAINTLDEAFYLSLNKRNREDAENAIDLLEKYRRLKGETELAIAKLSGDLLRELEEKLRDAEINELFTEEEIVKWKEEFISIKKTIGDISPFLNNNDSQNKTKVQKDIISEWERLVSFQIIGFSLFFLALVFIVWKYIIQRKNAKNLSKQFETMKIISRLENTNDISNRIINNSIELFNFDYAIVSIVDFFKHRISIQHFDTRNKEKVNPKNWMSDANFDLNEDDVLCTVVREKEAKTYIGRKTKLGTYPELNPKIVNENNHKSLNRIFIPIFHSKLMFSDEKNKEESNPVIGVIEAGYKETSKTRLLRKSKITKKIKTNYSLFVEVSTSGFYKAFEKTASEEIHKLIEKNTQIDDHESFINSTLIDIVNVFNVEIGEISFLNFDDARKTDRFFFVTKKGIDDKRTEFHYLKDKVRKGIIWHVMDTGKSYLGNDLKNDPYYYEENKNTLSELTVPLIYEDQVIGVINLESFEVDYFNHMKLSLVEKFVEKIIPVYVKKKLDIMLRSILSQFNNFSNVEHIHGLFVNVVSEYIKSDYVSLWELSNGDKADSNNAYFTPEHATDKLRIKLKNKGNLKVKDFNNNGLAEPILLDSSNKDSNFEGIKKYFVNLGFSSIVVVPIVIENKLFSFISIASKSNDIYLFHEDKVFLRQIASKAKAVLKYTKLFSEFSRIGSSLSKSNQKNTIINILKCAKDVLNSDLVTLIRYDSDRKKFQKNIEHNGDFIDEDRFNRVKENGLVDTYLAEKVLKADKIVFRNREEYDTFIKKREDYKDSMLENNFWNSEKIESLTAISLRFDEEPLGVIFFNYRSIQPFSNEFLFLMRAFASMASSALANVKHLEIINQQRKKLEEKAEILQFEYEEVFNKMQEMIPLAAKTSFYVVLQGANHDIRNIMLRMKQMTLKIKGDYDRLTQKVRERVDKRIFDLEKGMSQLSTILSIFNFKESKKENINTSEIIKELTKYFVNRVDYNVKFDVEELSIQEPLLCYKSEFSMIFYNLFNNSIYAIIEKKCELGLIKVSSFSKDNKFIFIVEDNGMGIDNSDISKIFDAGFTRKEKGLGIGLFFVKQCLFDNFSGDINCESKYGIFTRFTITIQNKYDNDKNN